VGCVIKVDRVNVSLGGNWLLRNLSFEMQLGEFIGIIGPNGAGKTTLLRTLLGLIQPDSGSIYLESDNARDSSAPLFGYAPQSRQIDMDTPLNAWDFVSFGLPRWFPPWLTKDDRNSIQEAMLATDSDSYAQKSVSKLSGGERQRLFIAQALVRNPQILLLDEPTSNLDPGAQENIAALVNRLNRERGIGVLFVTHDVNLIANYAHRILYLTKGNYAIGTTEEVLQSSVLSNLYSAPVEVTKVGSKILVMVSAAESLTTSICFHGDCFHEEVVE
jgi:zinc/manganese transport system ATP-binding protein